MTTAHRTGPEPHFHQGEAAVQADWGVDTTTFNQLMAGLKPELQPNEIRFVNELTFSVATSIDAQGRPWVSPLFASSHDEPLFTVDSPFDVRVRPSQAAGDPLLDNIAATGELGVLFFEPARRRRAKSLGQAQVTDDGTIDYKISYSFGLCTKYIFKREHTPANAASDSRPPATASRQVLNADDTAQLRAANTIFLGSFHADKGADPTHRGGDPGFVQVINESTIAIPDYAGNGMFNTLGNLRLDPRMAVTVIDFTTGRTLHLTGTTETVANEGAAADQVELRTTTLHIDEVIVTQAQVGDWTDIEAFDVRPGLFNPATPFL